MNRQARQGRQAVPGLLHHDSSDVMTRLPVIPVEWIAGNSRCSQPVSGRVTLDVPDVLACLIYQKLMMEWNLPGWGLRSGETFEAWRFFQLRARSIAGNSNAAD